MIFKQAYISLAYVQDCLFVFFFLRIKGGLNEFSLFDFVGLNFYDFFSKQLDVYLDEKYDQLFLRFGTYPTWP